MKNAGFEGSGGGSRYRDTQMTTTDRHGRHVRHRHVHLPPGRVAYIGRANGEQEAKRLMLSDFYPRPQVGKQDRLVLHFPANRFVTSSFLLGLLGEAMKHCSAETFLADEPQILIGQGPSMFDVTPLSLVAAVIPRIQREQLLGCSYSLE